jgi:hypothetical protein
MNFSAKKADEGGDFGEKIVRYVDEFVHQTYMGEDMTLSED